MPSLSAYPCIRIVRKFRIEHWNRHAFPDCKSSFPQLPRQRAWQVGMREVLIPSLEDARHARRIFGVDHERPVVGVQNYCSPSRPQHSMQFRESRGNVRDVFVDLSGDRGVEAVAGIRQLRGIRGAKFNPGLFDTTVRDMASMAGLGSTPAFAVLTTFMTGTVRLRPSGRLSTPGAGVLPSASHRSLSKQAHPRFVSPQSQELSVRLPKFEGPSNPLAAGWPRHRAVSLSVAPDLYFPISSV